MKKRLLIILLCIFGITSILVGCGAQPLSDVIESTNAICSVVTTITPSGQELQQIDPACSEVSEMNRTGSPTYSQEEMERDFSVFLGHIDSLGADEVTRLQMEYCDGLTSKVFETTDRELIVQWINLLKKSRFSVHPSDLIAGAASVLTVTINGSEVRLGSFMGPDVIISNAALGEIENYSELAEEFEALEKAMMAL